MGMEFKIDTKGIMEKIKKQIEQKPEILLKQNTGKTIDAVCPKCGANGILVTSSGVGECNSCGANLKIEMDVTYK